MATPPPSPAAATASPSRADDAGAPHPSRKAPYIKIPSQKGLSLKCDSPFFWCICDRQIGDCEGSCLPRRAVPWCRRNKCLYLTKRREQASALQVWCVATCRIKLSAKSKFSPRFGAFCFVRTFSSPFLKVFAEVWVNFLPKRAKKRGRARAPTVWDAASAKDVSCPRLRRDCKFACGKHCRVAEREQNAICDA